MSSSDDLPTKDEAVESLMGLYPGMSRTQLEAAYERCRVAYLGPEAAAERQAHAEAKKREHLRPDPRYRGMQPQRIPSRLR